MLTRLTMTLLLEKFLPGKQGSKRKLLYPQENCLLAKMQNLSRKLKELKKPAKKSTTAPTTSLSEAAQLKEATKRSKKDFHISQAIGSGVGTDLELGVPDEQQRKTSGTVEGTDDNDDDSEDDNDDDVSKGDDDKADSDDDDGSDAHDSERTDSVDVDENHSFTLKDYDEEHDEEYESDDDNENVFEEEDDDDLYKDVDPYEKFRSACDITASQKTDDSKQSSYVSLDFANQFIILEKAPPSDHEVASLMNIKMSHKVPSTQISSPLTEPVVIPDSSTIASTTVPPTILMITPLP
ncbi:hypothetical protein Tco_0401563 [Tanacetum coccineum]